MSDDHRGRGGALAEGARLEQLEEAFLDRVRLGEDASPLTLRDGDLSIYVNDLAVGQRAFVEGRGLTLRIHVPDDAVMARYDARAVEQILLNLLDNAVKHGASQAAPEVEVHVRLEGDAAAVLVCDRGPGIPEAERDRAFEPSRAPRGSGAAVGRGLSIVRSQARRLGGTARLEPRDGGGTVARVTLPLPRPSGS